MTPNKLPPLPESYCKICDDGYWVGAANLEDTRYGPAKQDVYTADQMHAYAAEALRQSQSLPAGAVAGLPVTGYPPATMVAILTRILGDAEDGRVTGLGDTCEGALNDAITFIRDASIQAETDREIWLNLELLLRPRKWLGRWDEVVRQVLAELDAGQAKIDALMLEYCPDEMTPDQVANWAAHQVPSPSAEADAVRLATQPAQASEAELPKWDRILRTSVPDRWKGCTNPVGAAQSYIAELEEAVMHLAGVSDPDDFLLSFATSSQETASE